MSFNGLLDESIKLEMNYERMIKRTKPAFLQNGTVTAGNSCGVNDGACAVLVMEERQARKLGYKPVLRFVLQCCSWSRSQPSGDWSNICGEQITKRNEYESRGYRLF